VEKMKSSVILCGQEFKVSGEQSPAYIQGIADFVNQKIETKKAQYPNLSVGNAVLLASLEIADELHQLRADYDALHNSISALRELSRTASPRKAEEASQENNEN